MTDELKYTKAAKQGGGRTRNNQYFTVINSHLVCRRFLRFTTIHRSLFHRRPKTFDISHQHNEPAVEAAYRPVCSTADDNALLMGLSAF